MPEELERQNLINEMKRVAKAALVSGLLGGALAYGIVDGCVVQYFQDRGTQARVYSMDGEGSEDKDCMRISVPWGLDSIFVQGGNTDNYFPLDIYLESLANQADRELREAEIKKSVYWYE